MPNKPRTENPARPIRFDTLWTDVQRLAAEDGTTTSEVVREAVRRYVKARKRQR
jgi:metal-responsive CopG/Arc/MetJ family transcriptional regulator